MYNFENILKPTKKPKKPTKKTSKKSTKKTIVPDRLKYVDVAFIFDTTGSMQAFIDEAKKHAANILVNIQQAGGLDIRVALIEYRDHPPQDMTFASRAIDFSDIKTFNENLAKLVADGGGDRDESVWDGVNELFSLTWRENSDRVAYLIGDSPAHKPCACNITLQDLLSNLQRLGIEVNAHSIAGCGDTTADFKSLTEPTGGMISLGRNAQDTTILYTDSLTAKSATIGMSDSFIVAANSMRKSYSGAASYTVAEAVDIGKKAGLTSEESLRAHSYLSKRGL